MKRSILALSILATSAMSAMAQGQPAANAATPTPPRPATTAQVPSPSGPIAVQPAFGGARNVATSPELARQAFAAGMQAKQATCAGKGPLYKWVAPHTVGEPNPKGGFWSNTFGGGCRKIGLSEAIAKGAVTIRQ